MQLQPDILNMAIVNFRSCGIANIPVKMYVMDLMHLFMDYSELFSHSL